MPPPNCKCATMLFGMSNNELRLIIRIFIKKNNNYLFESIINMIIYYQSSTFIIYNFLRLSVKKINILDKVRKFYLIYKNNTFWNLLLYDQVNYLLQLQNRFNSMFDCAKGGKPFYYKIAYLFADRKTCKQYIITVVIDRLLDILQIFNQDFFTALEIPLIKISDFYELPPELIIKYIRIVYNKITKLLNNTIKLFNLYNRMLYT